MWWFGDQGMFHVLVLPSLRVFWSSAFSQIQVKDHGRFDGSWHNGGNSHVATPIWWVPQEGENGDGWLSAPHWAGCKGCGVAVGWIQETAESKVGVSGTFISSGTKDTTLFCERLGSKYFRLCGPQMASIIYSFFFLKTTLKTCQNHS